MCERRGWDDIVRTIQEETGCGTGEECQGLTFQLGRERRVSGVGLKQQLY